MENKKIIMTVSYEGFDIQSSANLRETLWYTAYEIAKDGVVVMPWRQPDIDGRGSEEAACEWGITLAIGDIEVGLKKIFV
jgi:hypothetical protein